MIDINAAMGIVQLKKIERHWKIRKKLFELYKKKLNKLPFKFQEFEDKDIKHAYHLLLLIVDKKRTKIICVFICWVKF